MSGYPVMLRGEQMQALVVGGGAVAARKTAVLVQAGAAVRLVAPSLVAEVEAMARAGAITHIARRFEPADVAGAGLVFAATDDRAVNARVAEAARAVGALVNLADDRDGSDFVTPAVHRVGALTVAVSAGRLPRVAARVRDAIAARFDDRYAQAIDCMTTIRAGRLDAGARAEWRAASDALLGDDFCASVEDGRFLERTTPWR